MNHNIIKSSCNFHLAGIVPVSGCEVAGDSKFILHPSLWQLSEHLLSVERSILELNYAGCETIWVVCNYDIQPILRARVGNSVTSFESLGQARFSPRNKREKLKQIPIFYVAIPATQLDKRDSLGWSILYGANQAFMTCAKISKWVLPSKYYVSFPYGVIDPKEASSLKKLLRSEYNMFFTHSGKSVESSDMLSFTFSPMDFKKIRKQVKSICSGSTSKPYWSSRNYNLDKFYNCGNIDNITNITIDNYSPCLTWSEYKKHLVSPFSETMEKYNLQKIVL